ncbi:beta-hexosaminidase [Vibrio albus]|uniref:beta-N-acetylhexosaminidase n=1 Tax=Vibrio albus TaxID=2200953 RepID=A0A2U3B5L2_9VIBR|nr:family 20 glycosylhydrolase [Vibrio albus]PWI32093.1 beta-hexosaminidase [Vibrio albus]
MNYRLELAALTEQDTQCRFALTLHNLNDHNLENWSLCFSFGRTILPDSLSAGTIQRTGSFYTYQPGPETTLTANGHFYLEFSVNTAPFRYLSDGIIEAFIQHPESGDSTPVDVTSVALLSPYHKRSAITECTHTGAPVIPAPQSLIHHEDVCLLSSRIQLSIGSNDAKHAAKWLKIQAKQYQIHLVQQSTKTTAASIRFITSPVLNEQMYTLKITPGQITIAANSSSGFMYGAATLLQLFPHTTEESLTLPCVTVQDRPRFRYRGMMLDCARHFWSVAQIKELLDQLACYKFNTFHWHLTDDEGWRLEIKAFPELTDIGSQRGPHQPLQPQFTHLAESYGGYYTQEQVREIIEYASERAITVIPEIDIPGHSRAAICSLPELLSEPEDTSAYLSIQGYRDNILNPALPGTYTFIDKVLEEVSALFPGPFVHIGADEVPDGVWRHSPACQKLMQKHDYRDARELQGHLLRHAEQTLNAKGKRMLGWEEASYGNKVSHQTLIFPWQNEDSAFENIRAGYDVVLQPAQYTYLDLAQDYAPDEPGVDWAGTLTLESVYHYSPLEQIPEDHPFRQQIRGIQCALWCEIIPTQQRMQYMLFPRLLAVAEVAWSQKQTKNWEDFLCRLKGHLPHLDKREISYRDPWK